MARPDRALLVDAGLTLGLGGVFLASTAGATDARELDGLGWALLAANVLPLLALRQAPLLVLACFSVAYPAWAALEYPTHLLQSLPTLAAMFLVGAAPRPLWWRALALLSPAEMLAAAASGIWPVDLLEIGYVAIMVGGSAWSWPPGAATPATWRRRRPPWRRPARSWPTGRCSRNAPASPATCMTSLPMP
jgi:hypothetical protein